MSKTSDSKPAEAQVQSQGVQDTPAVPAAEKRKTSTNWRVFEDAHFIPVRIRCEGFKSTHPADLSCHTAFPPTIENVLRHMNTDHSGGWFHIKFRISDGKTSDLWRQLEEAGVELQDFHCPHCRDTIAVSPRRIIYHLQNHPGAIRVNLHPQELCMELGFQRPDSDELDDLYGD